MKMNRTVLSNKKKEETRFVRSDLRGLQSYMINLPTLYNIQGEILRECVSRHDNTGAKEAKNWLDLMSDGRRLATITGSQSLSRHF